MKAAPDRLREAETLLALVESALKQVVHGPADRRVPGVRNVLVFGGALANTMKAIAKASPIFASWFDVQSPSADIESLRKVLLREPKTRRDYTQVQLASAGKEYGPRPANARVFFSGDRLGGVGWEIELPDGQIEKYYVQLPDDLPAGVSFDQAEALARRHVAQLREMMRHARAAVS